MTRKELREDIFKAIFERISLGEKNEFSLELFRENKSVDELAFFDLIVNGTEEKDAYLQKIIGRYAKDFAVERLYKIDLSLLVLASFEILFTSTPPKVAINEALELLKIFSTEKSAQFVNGILAAVLKDKDKLLQEYENPATEEEPPPQKKEELKERIEQQEEAPKSTLWISKGYKKK
ncbi:MAG: transcription antitermination factor NusB [Firmicutes bacterium]|nr:transcription antitermination factor NusB [Bacillota bacterium]